jgi:periplasmic divalent cation tolerance protein
MPSDDPIAVFITAPNREEARLLADALVTSRLAACVQILPEIESVYRWQGAIERQPEILLIAKTTRGKFAELETEVRRLHSYETPEIVALSITEGSAPYFEWLIKSGEAD